MLQFAVYVHLRCCLLCFSVYHINKINNSLIAAARQFRDKLRGRPPPRAAAAVAAAVAAAAAVESAVAARGVCTPEDHRRRIIKD